MHCPRIHSCYQILFVWIPPCGCSPYRNLWVPWYTFTITPQQYGLRFLLWIFYHGAVMSFSLKPSIWMDSLHYCHHFLTLVSFQTWMTFSSAEKKRRYFESQWGPNDHRRQKVFWLEITWGCVNDRIFHFGVNYSFERATFSQSAFLHAKHHLNLVW